MINSDLLFRVYTDFSFTKFIIYTSDKRWLLVYYSDSIVLGL